MSNQTSGLIGLVFLAFIIFFAMFFGTNMMASMDQSTDLSGTAYEETYNSSTTAIITSISFMHFMIYFIAVACLLGAIVGLSRMVR